MCDQWLAAAVKSDSIELGNDSERFRLRANGVVFHELNFEALCAAIVGLCRIQLIPIGVKRGIANIVDADHSVLWSWCGELFLGTRANLFSREEAEVSELYAATVHAALGSYEKEGTEPSWEQKRLADRLWPHHAQQMQYRQHLIVVHLAFPLLEALLRRSCSAFVSYEGVVVTEFVCHQENGRARTYKVGKKCSSLRDLLVLHRDRVAPTQLVDLMETIYKRVELFDPSKCAVDLVYTWRNQSLHGTVSAVAIGTTVLSLCFLISAFEIQHDFEARKKTALDQATWDTKHDPRSRAPWNFYFP